MVYVLIRRMFDMSYERALFFIAVINLAVNWFRQIGNYVASTSFQHAVAAALAHTGTVGGMQQSVPIGQAFITCCCCL